MYGKKSKSARIFAWYWSLRGIADAAFAVAEVGIRGRSRRGERFRCGGGATVADGVYYYSEWGESRSMVAEGRRQAVSARDHNGAACGAERKDSSHRGAGPYQRDSRPRWSWRS